jgi:deazaflavin-dependent oxidoreductase (nitroreductase family)
MEVAMTLATDRMNAAPRVASLPAPRFGGVLWRIVGLTNSLMVPFAGKRWNPVFAVVGHRGRKTGRLYEAPVGARRIDGGFVISLAFGAQVDWHRNLIASRSGTVRWRGRTYPVGAPERIDAARALAAFHPIQRAFLRLAQIDGYLRVRDVQAIAS